MVRNFFMQLKAHRLIAVHVPTYLTYGVQDHDS